MQFSINSCFVMVQDVPVTSAITDPPAGASIDPDEDEVTLKGYAWSGRCTPATSKAVAMHGWRDGRHPCFAWRAFKHCPLHRHAITCSHVPSVALSTCVFE